MPSAAPHVHCDPEPDPPGTQYRAQSRSLTSQLVAIGACREALRWVNNRGITTLQEAWEQCQRADWLVWLAARVGVPETTLVLLLTLLARPVVPQILPGHKRLLECLALAEAWARGEVPSDKLREQAEELEALRELVGFEPAEEALLGVLDLALLATEDPIDLPRFASCASDIAIYAVDASPDFRDRPTDLRALCGVVREHLQWSDLAAALKVQEARL